MTLRSNRIPISPASARVELDATLGRGLLGLRYQEQLQTQWCWATCAAMAGEHAKGTPFTQCNFASRLYSRACCNSSLPDGCNTPCRVTDVSDVYTSIGMKSVYAPGALSFAAIEAEISAGRPIEVGIKWSGGTGHVLMIVGVEARGGKEFVELLDPWPKIKGGKTGNALLSDLVAGFGRGEWKWVWTGIEV